jgi:hypothetical protein
MPSWHSAQSKKKSAGTPLPLPLSMPGIFDRVRDYKKGLLEKICFILSLLTWPCYHNMVCPQIAAGGDGFQIWRIPVNMLNNQLQATDSSWSFILGGCF